VEDYLFPIKFSPPVIQCLIALEWLFGKRIRETLRLRREDVHWDDEFLYANFTVQKKRSRKATLAPKRVLKKILLSNPYTHYIIDHVSTITEGWIFTGAKGRREKTVYWKDEEGKIIKSYHYVDADEGRLSQEYALQILKALDENICCHLFRHSLATQMAEHEATEEELMHWFDWDRFDTAHGYVRGGPRMTERLSRRTW
jgi:integrase